MRAGEASNPGPAVTRQGRRLERSQIDVSSDKEPLVRPNLGRHVPMRRSVDNSSNTSFFGRDSCFHHQMLSTVWSTFWYQAQTWHLPLSEMTVMQTRMSLKEILRSVRHSPQSRLLQVL